MNSYRLAKKNELHEVAALFTESFREYPLFQLLLAPGKDYNNQLFKLNYTNTKSYFQQNACFVGTMDGTIVSAVLLKKSEVNPPGFFQYLFNGGVALAAGAGIRRIIHILKTLDTMKEAVNRYGQDSWYIDSLAVAEGYQGKSLGSGLFNTFIFPYVSRHGGGPITLVTHTELNKKFYCKNGFEVFSEYSIGPEGNQITNYSFRQVVPPGSP
ncbi:hypothetical protein C2I18_05730 [Paenibacillus sp. PK3_47]|uniref:GNAT family N-acetyltransferase n=1 Tax=Paenibacillus sp. PK3_47 TaxID=2072642 RepID=UPI00201D7A8D|nr:GNAT family N-acetyltransferase [Paenibacillus sp. PK3_47]UQZ33102.1 hypothetical protein C2I18_05730 [Paenibacillus sp. PK3_47]